MRAVLISALVVMVSACASSAPPAVSPDLAIKVWKKPLDLTAEGENVDAISAAFAGRVSARYGASAQISDVKRDLERQGFQCRDVPPVEARRDYLVAACEKPRPHGFCSDVFVVSLRFASQGRRPDALFVRADGSFARSCVVPPAK